MVHQWLNYMGHLKNNFPYLFSLGAVKLGPFIFSRAIFWGGILSLGVFTALSYLFERTRWGLKLTAVAEDHAVSQSMGISVKRSIATAWVIGCLLSAWGAVVFLNGQTLSFGAASIGMTALPEAKLAREAEICYAIIACITDYDSWKELSEPVTVDVILNILRQSVDTSKMIIKLAAGRMPQKRDCECASALKTAIATAPEFIPDEQKQKLKLLIGKYIKGDS